MSEIINITKHAADPSDVKQAFVFSSGIVPDFDCRQEPLSAHSLVTSDAFYIAEAAVDSLQDFPNIATFNVVSGYALAPKLHYYPHKHTEVKAIEQSIQEGVSPAVRATSQYYPLSIYSNFTKAPHGTRVNPNEPLLLIATQRQMKLVSSAARLILPHMSIAGLPVINESFPAIGSGRLDEYAARLFLGAARRTVAGSDAEVTAKADQYARLVLHPLSIALDTLKNSSTTHYHWRGVEMRAEKLWESMRRIKPAKSSSDSMAHQGKK
jgi:hypothetical protein